MDYSSLKLKTWTFSEPVTALALTTEDNLLMVSLASRLIWWWPQTNERAEHGFHLPESPAARLNDGRADPKGNCWVGSMFNNVDAEGGSKPSGGSPGVLYRVDPDWHVWYFIRPITSTIAGAVSYLFLKAGLLVLESTANAGASEIGFFALAFIAGFNVDKFVAKIEEVAKAVWGIDKTRSGQSRAGEAEYAKPSSPTSPEA